MQAITANRLLTKDLWGGESNPVHQMFKYMAEETTVEKVNEDWLEIYTPFFDRYNDCIPIYVRPEGETVTIDDDGWFCCNTRDWGKARELMLEYEVERVADTFSITCKATEVGKKMFMFLMFLREVSLTC